MEWLLSIVGIHLVACLSPGPDILLVIRTRLQAGQRAALTTVGGILVGVCCQMALGLSGISYLLSQGPVFSLGISLAGGTWLLYMGITAIPKHGPAQLNGESLYLQNLVSTKAAFINGLGINLLNPKAFLYFVGLFSVLLGPEIPLTKRLAALLLMLMAQSIAFSLVAILLPDPRRNRPWLNAEWFFQLLFSLIFTGLGLWMWVRAAEHILSLY